MSYGPHGYGCNSKTYPIICKYCKQKVYFFSCDHGSRVFFDELGKPWPKHDCAQRHMEVISIPEITSDYEQDIIRGKEEYQQKQQNIVRVNASSDRDLVESGIIRELVTHIDILKKFRIEDTRNWRRTLKRLLDEPMVQITIHTGAIGDNVNRSFTFLVRKKIFKQKALAKGDFIECELIGYQIPGRETIWICEHLHSAYE